MSRTVYRGGSNRAQTRLAQLRYDPIGELVSIHQRLLGELQRMEDLRSGDLKEISPLNGRPRSYGVKEAEQHFALYDKLINVGDKLLRYAYGRVPETTTIENKAVQPLIVNLSENGESLKIGASSEDITDVEPEECDSPVEAVPYTPVPAIQSKSLKELDVCPRDEEKVGAPETKTLKVPPSFYGD